MKIPIIDNIVSSITPSFVIEIKLLDDKLRENVMATNDNDFSEVNKKAGVDIIFLLNFVKYMINPKKMKRKDYKW
ncbi:hypothetical protein ARAF_2622 [Arsenophonus endosymbiont of Aleurodicus floccissimus]|uniref:hypothetical protein n=1 Tax=Arsenophonus endosymbiont of Aleurodicus floccissimus TaxID=2152761 RepID=UPI000E6B378F|nr:hypothetical protein [Arsenophonus endosymbiont of Aleurodicus floccissimus]SPP32457.1 hypothetical protein ARAF_2622 [Arsenophonus endosymbiont of Aleurodicus floccissimus]